jgi:hypothetical protein
MRLLSLSLEEINQLAQEMERETKAIKEELFRICWFMRGGVTITEAYELDQSDREVIGKIIENNLETTKETGIPFF